jgi:hypothetical protein
MPDEERSSASHPAPSNSLLDLIDLLRKEFPELSPYAVVRCVSIVTHHPSSSALNVEALLRHTERVARARLTHLNELPGSRSGLHPTILTVPQPRVSEITTTVSQLLRPEPRWPARLIRTTPASEARSAS